MFRIVVAFLLMLCSSSSFAQTVYTYEYDLYGRLIKVQRGSDISGRVLYLFDNVDNRTSVRQGNVGGPTANWDLLFIEACGGYAGPLGVTYNDTDPDLPYDTLAVTSVSGNSYVSVSNGDVYFNGPEGYFTVNYTVQDQGGLTSSVSSELYVLCI